MVPTMNSKLSSAWIVPNARAAMIMIMAPMSAIELLCRNSNDKTTYTETKMNAETKIIGGIFLPSAAGTVNIRTAKAAIMPRPIAIFFGAAFGCAATSKTYVIIKFSYKYSSGSLNVLCNNVLDIVGDGETVLVRFIVEEFPYLSV
jgi:hypothetical protein